MWKIHQYAIKLTLTCNCLHMDVHKGKSFGVVVLVLYLHEKREQTNIFVNRYGSCVQFKANFETICDDFYEPDVDYIYVPHNRSDGSFSDLINQITVYGQLMLEPLQECKEIALRILCHYYLPPCGRQKQFTPPTAVCSEQCRLLPQLCPNEWAMVLEQFELNRIIIENVGLQLIDCDFPGKYLTPLPHCCTELSLNICKSISPIR